MASTERALRGRRPKRSSNRHIGEPCPLILMVMPCGVPLLLTVRLRKWLRKRVGRKLGNAIGKVAITLLGRPPFLLACVFMRLTLLVLKALNKVEEFTRKQGAA